MRIANIIIENFRGIKHCALDLPNQAVLVGDNNTGKSTVLEAIDLVLGPERLFRRPIVDEHDFYAGRYLDSDNNPIEITVTVTIIDLDLEQEAHFVNNLEWWDTNKWSLVQGPPPNKTDQVGVVPALRVGFRGFYSLEDDDFSGETFFMWPELDEGKQEQFRQRDKRLCGFLYLRTLRTGRRALSLERGSLLDVILKLKDLKPRMWEDVLSQLQDVSVANDPTLGISDILESVQKAIRELVPVECADAPAIRVSQMTREHLREILTVFLGTGAYDDKGKEYTAPFHHQGTGTINMLVLTLLSIIAELKNNVIFAMEEPEIALPPHTQKRIISSVTGNSAQALFTSHSPYVLEEFEPAQIIVIDRKEGILTGRPVQLPHSIKPKIYRDELKRRFCEALLARRVLIVEGRTEYDTFPRVSRKLHRDLPTKYSSLDSLGIAVINAETDSQIAQLGKCFKEMGKTTYAIYDKQSDKGSALIAASIDYPFESAEKGFENLILTQTSESALRRYAKSVIDEALWPQKIPIIDADNEPIEALKTRLKECFIHKKADGWVADCVCECKIDEMPEYVKDTLSAIRNSVIRADIVNDAEPEVNDEV